MIKMKDSRGNQSSTLGFTYIAFLVGTLAFIYSTYHTHTADLLSYGGFITGVMVPWVGREFISKKTEGSQDVS